MRRFKLALSIIAPLVIHSCARRAQDPSVDRFGELIPHLVGEWSDDESEPGAVIHERWKRNEDGLHSGLGFVMVDKDTVFIEHLRINTDSTGVPCYRARVPSQNAGGEITFRLTDCAGDSMVFENPAHDFPQRISYALQPDSTWNVRVSGMGRNGSLRTERFRFRRARS